MKQLTFLFIVTTLAGCFGAEPQKNKLEGKPLPEFSLLLTDSITWFNSRDILSGKPITIFYFSPFCPYCKAQAKLIVDNINELKDIQFYFISNHPLSIVKKFDNDYELKKYKNITIGIDTSDIVKDYFEVAGVSYIVIYGNDKKLNKTFMGKIYSNQIKKVSEE
jgi:peroxiredoxin